MRVGLFSISIVCFIILSSVALAGSGNSERLKPRWLSVLPRAGNPSWYFKVVYSDAAASLEEARVLARKELANSIEKAERIRIDESLGYHSVESGNTGQEKSVTEYSFRVESEGMPVYIRYERVDEYTESVYADGRRMMRLYTLFAVGRRGGEVRIEPVELSSQYGARGLVRSVIPGWGQMYKGSMVKGGCILGGEIALVAALISAESMRASYVKKMKENPRQLKLYNTKADQWENIRNVCIGGAAALYVYNLIDAIVAPGARRVVVRKQKTFALLPLVAPDYQGISLVFNF